MPSPLIQTSTLLDIARHSNKVIRISQYMLNTEAPFLIEKMAFLDQQSDPVDIIEALDNDLGVTANMIKSVALMVESLTPEHTAPELKAEESDFRALFPHHYNAQTQTLSLFGLDLHRSGDLSRRPVSEIKARLYQTAFSTMQAEYPLEQYKKHVSLLKALSIAPRPGPDSKFFESLSYAGSLAQVRRWDDFYRFAMAQVGRFHEYRKSMTPRDRELVDDKIYSGRTMLYGVVKTSTFITKVNGLEQLSSRHKDNKAVIEKIVSLVKEINCIRAVEIDQDASPSKIHDKLIDIKWMRLDFPDAFELKARKLGQYRFSGYYVKGKTSSEGLVPLMGVSSAELQLIAMDLSSPSVLAHELTHFRDKQETPFRTEIIEHFREKMDLTALADSGYPVDVSYWENHREILARIGEVGFLLNKYGYQENESLQAFADRVRGSEAHDPHQAEKLEYNVDDTFPLDYYLGVNNPFSQQVFFNMQSWTPAELSIVRDYTRNFFYSPDPKIQERLEARLANGELTYQTRLLQKLKEASSPRKIRQTEDDTIGSLFSKMQPVDVANIYKVGISERLFTDGEFAQAFRQHHIKVGLKPSQKRVSWDEWLMQVKAAESLAQVINPSENPGDALVLREMMVDMALSLGALNPSDIPEDEQRQREAVRILRETVTAVSSQVYGQMQKMTQRKVGHWVASGSSARSESFVRIKSSVASIAMSLIEASKIAEQCSPDVMMKASSGAQFIWAAQKMYNMPVVNTPSLKGDHLSLLSQSELLYVANLDLDAVQRYATSIQYSGLTRLVEPRELMVQMSKAELAVAVALIDDDFIRTVGADPIDVYQRISGNRGSVSEDDARLKIKDALSLNEFRDSASGKPSGRLTSMSAIYYSTQHERMRPVSALIHAMKGSGRAYDHALALKIKDAVQSAVNKTPEFRDALKTALSSQIDKYRSALHGKSDVALLNSPVSRVFGDILVHRDLSSQGAGPTKLMINTASELLVEDWVNAGIHGLQTTKVGVDGYGDVELAYGESARSVEIKRTEDFAQRIHAAVVAVVKQLPPALQEGPAVLRKDHSALLVSAHDDWKHVAEGAPAAASLLLQSAHVLSVADGFLSPGDSALNPSQEAIKQLSLAARQSSMFALISQSGIADVRPLIDALEVERKIVDVPVQVQGVELEPVPMLAPSVIESPVIAIKDKLGVTLDDVEPLVVEQDVPAAGDQPLSARNQMRLF
jgi:hypothetical protein